MVEPLVIIGSGPAAWTAAVYAARDGLTPLVYEGALTEENRVAGTLPFGQLNLTTTVENFPGFPDGVLGPDLMIRMKEQAERFGVRVVTEDVAAIDASRRPFHLRDSAGGILSTHTVILAAGATDRPFEAASADRFQNRGISMCAVSDGPLPRMRNRPVAVVGGGDSAAETALWMTRFSQPVYLIHRRDRLRANRRTIDRVFAEPRIQILWNSVVTEVLGDDERGMTGLRVRVVPSGHERVVEVFGLFPQIGRRPLSDLVRGQVRLDDGGYVVPSHPPSTATSVPGIFTAGEVADPVYRQAVTAADMGCRAAMDAGRWIRELGGV